MGWLFGSMLILGMIAAMVLWEVIVESYRLNPKAEVAVMLAGWTPIVLAALSAVFCLIGID